MARDQPAGRIFLPVRDCFFPLSETFTLGLGLTRVLSYQVADALGDGHLARMLGDHEPPAVPASLIHRGRGRLPMKTRVFIDFTVGRMRERLQAQETVASQLPPSTPVQRGR